MFRAAQAFLPPFEYNIFKDIHAQQKLRNSQREGPDGVLCTGRTYYVLSSFSPVLGTTLGGEEGEQEREGGVGGRVGVGIGVGE